MPRSLTLTILRRISLPFLFRLTSNIDSIWMSRLQRIDNLLSSASSPIDLSRDKSCDSEPKIRIESFRKFTGHSMVVRDSVGAGAWTTPPSLNYYRCASIAVVTSELAPIMLSMGITLVRLGQVPISPWFPLVSACLLEFVKHTPI